MKTYAFGKNGAVIEYGELRYLAEKYHLPPRIDVPIHALSGLSRAQHMSEHGDWKEQCESVYGVSGGYGDYGDILCIDLDHKDGIILEWIAPLAYAKPTLAADLIPFIRDKDGKLFWVGIMRGRPPGAQRQALIGGIRAIESREIFTGPTRLLESPLENLMHESGEEAGLNLSHLVHAPLESTPMTSSASVEIPGLIPYSQVTLTFVGVMRTDPLVERNPSTGALRVDETTGYTFLLSVPVSLATEDILRHLHPTDMSERTTPIVRRIRHDDDVLQISVGFHSQHHRLLFNKAYAIIAEL